jgi:two-component system NarL family response regulator
MKHERIRILIAEDHALVRQGIVTLLKMCPELEVVAEAGDGEEAVALFREHRPDLALLDLRMPKLDGAEVIARLKPEAGSARFMVLTTYDTSADVQQAVDAGAHGYLLKGIKYPELVDAIRDVVQRRVRRIPAELMDRSIGRSLAPELTGREKDILKLVAQGRSNQEIAAELKIVESTVKNHVTNILAKLGVTSRTQATLVALQRRLVRLDEG